MPATLTQFLGRGQPLSHGFKRRPDSTLALEAEDGTDICETCPDIPQTGGFPQQGDKTQVFRIVIVDPFATTATIHHVVPGAWKFYP